MMDEPWVLRLTSGLGLGVMVGLAALASEDRGSIRWRTIAWGVGLQLALGLVLLSPALPTPMGEVRLADVFYTFVGGAVEGLLGFSDEGAAFLFGTILPHEIVVDGTSQTFDGNLSPPLRTFAFTVLPTIIFFSSLMSMLYHLGVMQRLVRGIAWLMVRTLGTSGSESLAAAGNIFVGQTEAPLLVRPFVASMTRSELMAVMTAGFATVAGGVMGAYVKFLEDIPNIAGHLVMASIMSAPAALVCAKLVVPETEESQTQGEVEIEFPSPATNVVEAAARGASDGMSLAINVGAMLIAIVGLVAMVDVAVGLVPWSQCGEQGWSPGYCGPGVERTPLSLSVLLGTLFAPLAFLMGIPFAECDEVGRLLGEKIVLTEFVAYAHLGEWASQDVPVLSERSTIIASYALCGFANFASIGIQLGGIGGIAPERMGDLASLGFKAMAAGMLAACMTGAVVGMLV
ncbi:MAG: nucleoside transporter C-terminal domain-containing protein [Myxococcota bacterium]